MYVYIYIYIFIHLFIYVHIHIQVLELASNHGFGFAVRAALELVTTPLVCVIQHDRTFMRDVDIEPIVRSMLEHQGRVGYVLMHTRSTGNYPVSQHSRLRSKGVKAEDCDIAKWAVPLPAAGRRLLPCLTWRSVYVYIHMCIYIYIHMYIHIYI